MGILIRPATTQDEDAIFKFLCQNYYPDEPLNVSVNRKVSTNKRDCPYLAQLPKGLSFVAVDEENPENINGVFLNKIIEKDDPSAINVLIKEHKNTPYEKLLKFIKYVNHEFQKTLNHFYKKTGATRSFDVTIISVKKECRRQNIAGRLMEATIDLAKSQNIALMTIHCSSAYSAKLAARHGFSEVFKLPYKDYADENGERTINPPEPHANFTVLLKTLK